MQVPVWVTVPPHIEHPARLLNLSLSGALLQVDFDLRHLSRVEVRIGPVASDAPTGTQVAAYVARAMADQVAVEWCEFAPQCVAVWLRIAMRGNPRILLGGERQRRPEEGLS